MGLGTMGIHTNDSIGGTQKLANVPVTQFAHASTCQHKTTAAL